MPVLGNTQNMYPSWNQTGGALAIHSFVSLNGFNTSNSLPTMQLALANGTNRRADGIIPQAIANQGAGYVVATQYVLEGQDTSLRAIGDPVYLSPIVAGAPTFTRPSTAGQDVQEIGVVLSVSATAGRILINCVGGEIGQGPDAVSDTLLASKMHRDIGQGSFGYVRITGAVADGDRISINARIYEFDTAAAPGAIGAGANVRIGVSAAEGGTGAANAITALVAAINGDASRAVNAADIGGNIAGLVALLAGSASDVAITDPIDAGAVIVISAATLTGGGSAATQMRCSRRRTLTATDVAVLAASLGTNEIVLGTFASTTQPSLRAVQGWTAAGRPQLLDGATFTLRQANSAFWLLCYAEPGGGALLAAGDSIAFELVVAG